MGFQVSSQGLVVKIPLSEFRDIIWIIRAFFLKSLMQLELKIVIVEDESCIILNSKDLKETSCGTCAFFGKMSLCPRRERYAGAITCRLYERKIEATSPLFPLLPDTGVRVLKEEDEEILESPSLLWYLVPFFFGILGGIVGYVAVKDRDEDMASGLLLFGIIWTVVVVILYFAIISYYLSILF